MLSGLPEAEALLEEPPGLGLAAVVGGDSWASQRCGRGAPRPLSQGWGERAPLQTPEPWPRALALLGTMPSFSFWAPSLGLVQELSLLFLYLCSDLVFSSLVCLCQGDSRA